VSINHRERRRPRIAFFGMHCETSTIPLRHLLDARFDVVAVVLYESLHHDFQPRDSSVTILAHAAGIPVLTMHSVRSSHAFNSIAAYQPELIAVSCFPRRIPPHLLTLPRLGCLNVHPSLLPAGRGPEPVFWTLRHGERRTGVTIHLMDEGFDTGPILAQQEVDVPFGIRAPDLERDLAERGGELLVGSIEGLTSGEIQPRPQDPARATFAPVPAEHDFLVPTNLPAGWAYAFVRGVSPLGGPLAVWITSRGARIRILDAQGWNDQQLATPYHLHGETLTVRFRDGNVSFKRLEG
jgi:methionyl-tRNA formyltransferase